MTPEFTISPPVALRGQRDYFHSTDLYAELVAGLEVHGVAAKGFELKIKEKITAQPQIDFYRAASFEANAPVAALARFETDGGDWLALVSQGTAPIMARKAYDETPLWTRISHHETQFEISDCQGYAPIEVVTAVGVFAHKTLFPPSEGERWLLAQIVARRLLDVTELEYFKVDVARKLGPKLTQSNLVDKTGIFGKMLFILK